MSRCGHPSGGIWAAGVPGTGPVESYFGSREHGLWHPSIRVAHRLCNRVAACEDKDEDEDGAASMLHVCWTRLPVCQSVQTLDTYATAAGARHHKEGSTFVTPTE